MESLEITLTVPEHSTHVLCCGEILRTIKGRRTVFDGTYDGRAVIVKRFEDWLGGGYRCQREKRGLERLADRGLATPEVLLAGKDDKGRHVLVIEKIEGAVDGVHALKAAESGKADIEMLFGVFRYTARMHQAGVVQKDMHLGNFLFAGSSVWAIDPAWMRFHKRPITSGASRVQLAALAACLPKKYSSRLSDFLYVYCDLRGLHYSDEMLDSVRQLAARYRKKWLPHTLKKTLRNSKQFFVLEAESCRGVFCKAAFSVESARALLEKITSASCGRNQEVICDFNGRRFRFVPYGPNTGIRLPLSSFVKSKARRDWLAAWKARYSGQKNPTPAALVERYCGPMITQCWLVRECEPVIISEG